MTLKSFLNEGHNLTDKEVERAINELLKTYSRAEKEVKIQLQAVYAKYLTNVPKAEYYNVMIKFERLSKLQQEIQNTYIFYDKMAGKQIVQAAQLSMSNSYYRTQYATSWQAPLKFIALDQRLVELSVFGAPELFKEIQAEALRKIKSGTWRYGRLEKYIPQYGTLTDLLARNRLDAVKKINQTITQGFIQGNSYKTMAGQIQDVFATEAFKAQRIAHTETHRVAAHGDYLVAKDVEAQGTKIVRQWSSVLDTGTRSNHAALDGEIVGIDEPFSAGIMTPGDWPEAGDLINCRCVVNLLVVKDGKPLPPELRRGRNPVADNDGKFQNEVFSYRQFDKWAEENNLKQNKNGEYYKN